MNLLRTVLPSLALLAAATAQADGGSKTVLGANEALAAGADALMAGDFEEGIRQTLRGLRAEAGRGSRARALSNLCAGYTGAGRHEEALAACDEAIALNAGNWRAFNNRSLALAGLGRVREARADLEAAVGINPASPQLARTRAWIEARAPRTVLADAGPPVPLTE